VNGIGANFATRLTALSVEIIGPFAYLWFLSGPGSRIWLNRTQFRLPAARLSRILRIFLLT
jgi:hypothetical protein